jgi:hypothetical protein
MPPARLRLRLASRIKRGGTRKLQKSAAPSFSG